MSDSAKSNWQGSDTMGCRIHILSHPHRGRVTPRVNWHTWSFSSLWFWGGRRRFTGTYMMLICVCLSLLAETPAVCSAARSRRWVTLDSLIKESSYILWTRCLCHARPRYSLSLSLSLLQVCIRLLLSFQPQTSAPTPCFSCILHHFRMKQSRNEFHKSS